MPTFTYILLDHSGKKIKGEIKSDDYNSAAEALKKQNKIIFSLKEKKGEIGLFKKKKVSSQDLAVFFRQLAILIKSGIPLMKSLENIKKQAVNSILINVSSSMQKSLSAGFSFSEAMSKHSDVFSEFSINMVKAGEISGTLDITLERLASYLEESNRLTNQIRNALTYPALVITFITLVLIGLFVKVIPAFEQIFNTLNIEPPLPTKMFLMLSVIVRKAIGYVVIGGVVLFIAFRRYISLPKGRWRFDRFKLKVPLVKEFFRKIYSINFTRNLAIMLGSGLPILLALESIFKVINNKFLEEELRKVKEAVNKGEKFATALGKINVFSQMVLDLINVGEETGRLDEMLNRIADFYEEEVMRTLNTLISMLEPAVIIFLGVVVGSIVVSLFLPILKITQTIGGVG